MAKHKSVFRTRHSVGKKSVYAKRDPKGRFVDIEDIGRAIRDDMKKKAKTKVKPQYGFKGDILRKKKK